MRAGGDLGKYVPDVKLTPKLHAYEDVRTMVEWNGRVLIQNFDVHVLEVDASGISSTLHVAITGVALFLMLMVAASMCSPKTDTFWK
jgi:hypothetical protein